jgi:hypothetical protein
LRLYERRSRWKQPFAPKLSDHDRAVGAMCRGSAHFDVDRGHMGQRARNDAQRYRRRIGRVVDCDRGLRGEIAQRRGCFLRLIDRLARKLREEIGRHVRVRLPADQVNARDERRAQISRCINNDAIRKRP